MSLVLEALKKADAEREQEGKNTLRDDVAQCGTRHHVAGIVQAKHRA